MPVDHSIYFQQQPLDILGNVSKGMQMRDQLDQRKAREAEQIRAQQEREQKAQIGEVYRSGLVKDENGNYSYDYNKINSGLAQLGGNQFAGQTAYDFNQNLYKQNTDAQRYQDSQTQQEKEFAWKQSQGLTDNDLRRQSLQSAAADRKEARDEKRYQAGIAKQDKYDARIDSDIQKLSKEVSGVQDATNALDEIEKVLGFPIDSAKVENGKVSVNGKNIDLPGVSVPFIGRVSAYSNEAQNLQSAASKVFNTILKDRSGAAVTNSELERLKTEFGEGKYNTESQMVAALQRYKRGVQQELQNREAGFRPDVVSRYAEQGGRTSKRSELSARPSDPIPKSPEYYSKMSDDQLLAAYKKAGGK